MESLNGLTVSGRVELVAGALLLIVLIAEGWLLMQMMTQRGRLLPRIEALEKRLGMSAQPAPGPRAWHSGSGLRSCLTSKGRQLRCKNCGR